ncbi:retrovirus-related pol polyprotein from transposon TNT 1-94 [Tanacetum coccineum]
MTTLESCNKHNIVNWEYILLGMTEAKDSEVCKITRADGTSSFHGDFQALLRRLDRQDLFQLYSLVQERYKHRSIEGHDLDLWGDLKMMFDPNEEDDIWLNQHYWELLRWKLHEYSGVHSLFLDGTSIQINMLVDKKYPLKKEILKKMINLKIEAEEESDMASELIKFIKSQIAEQKIKFEGNNTPVIIQPPCYSASKDFQDSPDDEEDTRSSQEYLNDLEEEYQAKALLAKSKSQVKDNKIDLLVQQYEQFTILEEESIDSGFARFNTIITSLKAIDEGFSSKKYVRKFLRDLHPKWRAKVTVIKESKDLSSLALDELIRNLKVHEVVMEKDSKIYRGKKERVKFIALKAKKESSNDETSTFGSDDEEYAMSVKNFKKFFRRTGKFVRQPGEEKKSFRQRDEKKGKSDRKCFRFAKMTPRTKLTMKLVSWLNRQMRVCLRTCLEPDKWIKDSGFSKHMTGNKSLFSTYKAYDEGNVVFGINLKGKIIVVDDYSIHGLSFLKNEAFEKFEILSKKTQNQLGSSIGAIRTDDGWEFDNEVQFEAYCDAQDVTHNFSAPRTPQSNGVVERKNRTLQEMSRTMLNEQSIPQSFGVTPLIRQLIFLIES